MQKIEMFIERIILGSRWILVVFYLGLAVGLLAYAVAFTVKLWEGVRSTLVYTGPEMILAMLGLIDAALVASLLVMVMLSGYSNFVSRFDGADEVTGWLGRLDSETSRSG